MTIKRKRLKQLRADAAAGTVSVTPAELLELCDAGLHFVNLHEQVERSRREAAKDAEPMICELCNLEIKPGEPHRAGQAHWDCYEKAKNA